ncbi:hypothetical protein J4405_03800 [Candidatus Woesearchaeota archaeon]|nr:hypothetical protein [Candidatus Woesearchaeota archaeon]
MKKISKSLYWTPRIFSILFILFLALFSLDVITPEASFGQILLGLFMHNIPVFILTILLVITWKHEIVGAITFFTAGLLYIITLFFSQNFQWFMLLWSITISGPSFLISYLFWLNWKKHKRGAK